MPRRASPRPRTAPRKPVERATALRLRARGLSFEAIGARLGITRQSAWELVERELRDLAAERRAGAEHLRELELLRLDEVQAGLHPLSAKGSHLAAAAEMKLMERRARLLGLDAPAAHELSGPGGAPIPVVAQVALLPALDADVAQTATDDPLAAESGPADAVPREPRE